MKASIVGAGDIGGGIGTRAVAAGTTSTYDPVGGEVVVFAVDQPSATPEQARVLADELGGWAPRWYPRSPLSGRCSRRRHRAPTP